MPHGHRSSYCNQSNPPPSPLQNLLKTQSYCTEHSIAKKRPGSWRLVTNESSWIGNSAVTFPSISRPVDVAASYRKQQVHAHRCRSRGGKIPRFFEIKRRVPLQCACVFGAQAAIGADTYFKKQLNRRLPQHALLQIGNNNWGNVECRLDVILFQKTWGCSNLQARRLLVGPK